MEKKTIGVITIQSANYGSTLQMFALYTMINKLGYDCFIIDYKYPDEYHRLNAIGNENKVSNNYLSVFVLARKGVSLYKHIIRYFLKKTSSSRITIHTLDEFINVCNKTSLYDRKSILTNPPKFDIYMTGSDQVWNPRYYHKDYSFLLNFTREDQIRVSYASSFGSKEILPQYAEDYARLLKRYDRVSVRERSGVNLYKQLTGKDATYCLDPTMLLTKDMWRMYSSKNVNLQKEKYILCYIQSYAFNPYPYIDRLIKRVKKLTGYKVKIITKDLYEKIKGYEVENNVGPREFLDLYYNASFVIACSFHAVVFSVIMRKPFFAVMNNKITNDDRQANIISEFNLQKRAFRIGDDLPTKEDIPFDYSDIENKIEDLRSSSIQYLKEVLE